MLDFGNLPTVMVCGNEMVFKYMSGVEVSDKSWGLLESFRKLRYVDSKGKQVRLS